MDMMLPEGSGTTAYTRPKTRVYRVWTYAIAFTALAAKQRMLRTE
jgi:CheY-like chemotaxis protein